MIIVKTKDAKYKEKFIVKNPKKILFWKKMAEYNPQYVRVFE
jgi:hypothetical protein